VQNIIHSGAIGVKIMLRDSLNVIKKLYYKVLNDQITALGAQVAYYLLLSFFPFLIFLITFLSYTNIVNTETILPLSKFLPTSVYMLVLDVTKNIIVSRNTAFISLGMIATIWSASAGVLAFMYGMNRAYSIKETRPFWWVRTLSIIFTLGLSIIIILSILLVVFGELLGSHLSYVLNVSGHFNIFWDILRYTVSIGTMFIVFVLFYIYVPSCNLAFKDAIPGAIFSTAGWTVLSIGFAFYVNNFSNFSKTYGSIGAMIALLIWLYWSSVIVFIGSELNSILYKGIKKPKCK
jgi:Predicted membrane protein